MARSASLDGSAVLGFESSAGGSQVIRVASMIGSVAPLSGNGSANGMINGGSVSGVSVA